MSTFAFNFAEIEKAKPSVGKTRTHNHLINDPLHCLLNCERHEKFEAFHEIQVNEKIRLSVLAR